MQMLEQFPTRGFQSSVDPRPHFGLGASTQIDSLVVIWPDRRTQVLTNVTVDRAITLSQQDASPRPLPSVPPMPPVPPFSAVTGRVAIDLTHRENRFYDFHCAP